MRLVWYVALPATLWIALVAWYSTRMLDHELERSLQEDVELVGRAIRAPLASALQSGNVQEVSNTLLSTLDIGRVYGLMVYDDHSQLIATAGDIDSDGVVTDLGALAEEGRYGTYERIGGRRVYSYFLPLYDSGNRLIGLLQITRRQRDIDQSLNIMRIYAALLAAIGVTGLAVLAIFGHHRALRRHLNHLGRDLLRLQHGDSAHRVDIRGPAEIADLGRSINDMLDAIANAENEIAQRRERENELRQRLAQSEKLAALGHLAAGVAHELGTPLSTIDGHAQRLARASDLDEGRRISLQRIRQEVQRTERTVRQLLEVGRTQRRQHYPLAASMPLRAAASACAEITHQHDIDLQLEILTDAEIRIFMDPGRVEQALVNLIANACQASPPGGTVTCRLSQGDGFICYAIVDQGAGVSKDLQQRIFEPFFTTKPVGKGTGLGLAVVHSVAIEHGGQINVDNKTPSGCVFSLTLSHASSES